MLPCVVVTEVDANTNTNEADGVVAQVLGDTNSLITELNAEGADVSGASTQAVSADNCTSNTIVSNSNRGITGTPCVGATGEACDFECFAGYTKFGEHTCKPDGKFCKSHRRPCRRNPVSLWPHRHGWLHKISLPHRCMFCHTSAGGVCAPAGKVPFRCGVTGDLLFVTSVALLPPPPGSMLGGSYSATPSTIARFQLSPPPPPSADKICGRGP